MNNRFSISATRLFYCTLTFIACWYFYFASSFKIRPFPQLFWMAMAGLSAIIAFIHKFKFNHIDIAFLGGMAFLLVTSLFSVDTFASMKVVANYIIYYMVARMITKNCDGQMIHSILLFFSIIHLVCLYMQVLIPNVYTDYILPLLPEGIYATITEQMEWNAAYYGFSVQTSMSAMYLSIGAVLSAIKAKNSDGTMRKWGYIALVILFLIATFFTQRRGSSAASLVVLALIYMQMKGNRGSKIVFAIAIVLLIAIVGIQNIPGLSGILNKMTSFMATGSILNGRDVFFKNAVSAIFQKPLFGWGGGQVQAAIGYAWLENAYLSVLVQWGTIGFIVFYAPYLKILKRTTMDLRYKKGSCIEFAFYMQILFLIMSTVENYFGEALNIFIFFVIVLAQDKESVGNK